MREEDSGPFVSRYVPSVTRCGPTRSTKTPGALSECVVFRRDTTDVAPVFGPRSLGQTRWSRWDHPPTTPGRVRGVPTSGPTRVEACDDTPEWRVATASDSTTRAFPSEEVPKIEFTVFLTEG